MLRGQPGLDEHRRSARLLADDVDHATLPDRAPTARLALPPLDQKPGPTVWRVRQSVHPAVPAHNNPHPGCLDALLGGRSGLRGGSSTLCQRRPLASPHAPRHTPSMPKAIERMFEQQCICRAQARSARGREPAGQEHRHRLAVLRSQVTGSLDQLGQAAG